MLFSKIYKYNYEVSSIDLLKLIAIVTMIIDHAGFYFLEDSPLCFVIGRLAAPLFFFITGYVSIYKISPLLLLGGGVLTTTNFYFEGGPVNILINFILIKWILNKWDPCQKAVFHLAVMVALLLSANRFWGDDIILEYDTLGLAYSICGRLVAGKARGNLVLLILFSTLSVHFYQAFFRLELRQGDGFHNLLLLMVFISLFVVMLLFQYKIFKIEQWVKNIILVLSRYSLEVYFLHYLVFQVIWFYGLSLLG